MCDYSLHDVKSRPAQVGDRLVTTAFVNTATRGFSGLGERNVAVCLLPGTEIVFEQEARTDHLFGRMLPKSRFGKLGDKVARFRQINTERPDTHHDALEFGNGKVVLLHHLRAGQRATVLQMPAAVQTASAQAASDAGAAPLSVPIP
jgi:hypothetical protein